MTRLPALVAVVFALLAAGCLGTTVQDQCNDHEGACGEPTAAPPTGELRGLVVMQGGPVADDGPASRPLKDARIAVTVRSPTGETLIRSVLTDEHGRFSLRLLPGWYTLTARFNYPLLPPLRVVKVKSGQVVGVRFTESIK